MWCRGSRRLISLRGRLVGSEDMTDGKDEVTRGTGVESCCCCMGRRYVALSVRGYATGMLYPLQSSPRIDVFDRL